MHQDPGQTALFFMFGLYFHFSHSLPLPLPQIKRRPSEALPELLLPIAPISGSQRQDSPSGLASLESGLSHLEVDDWDF